MAVTLPQGIVKNGIATTVGSYNPSQFANAPAGSYEAQLYAQSPQSTGYKPPAPGGQASPAPVITASNAQNDFAQKQAAFNAMQANNAQQQLKISQQKQMEEQSKAMQLQQEQAQKNVDAQNQLKQQEINNKASALNPTPTKPVPVPTYGSNVTDQSGAVVGQNKFDPNTGKPLTPPAPTTQDNLNQATTDYNQGSNAIDAARTDAYNSFHEQVGSILNGTFPLSVPQQALVTSLQKELAQNVASQTIANNAYTGAVTQAGFRQGGEYTPQQYAGQIANAISYGVAKISALDNEAAKTMATLQNDFQKQDYEMLNKNYDSLTKMLDDKGTHLNDMYTKVTNTLKDQRDQEQKQQDKVSAIALDAAKNGAPQSVQDKISSAKNETEAISAAGDFIQTATGQVGDYLQYKRDAITNGHVPIDYSAWKTADDKRAAALKSSEAYATAFASAKGKAAGEAAGAAAAGASLTPVAADNGVVYNVPASVAPYVKVSPNGTKYVDASGLSAAEKGKIIKDAYNGGKNPIPVITDAAQSLDVANIKDAANKLADMKNAFSSENSGNAAERDLYAAAAMTMAKKLETDPNAVGTDVYQIAALDILKAVSGTKGFRGGASMVQAVEKVFPKNTDTQAVINSKIGNMSSLLNDRERALVGVPNTSDQVLIDEKNHEANIQKNLDSIKDSNPVLWGKATAMYLYNINSKTGQPYTAEDVLSTYPELNK